MKSQARLRLRQAGRHCRTDTVPAWPQWTYHQGVQRNLVRAFEMNVWPRHYADDDPPASYQMTNYLTGEVRWHRQLDFKLVVGQ